MTPPIDENEGSWDGLLTSSVPLFAFPILPRERRGVDMLSIDTDNLGTAFFVSSGTGGGLFLTAKHCVDEHWRKHNIQVLYVDGEGDGLKFRPLDVAHLALHPEADFAVGAANSPVQVPSIALGFSPLEVGTPIAAWGYAHTKVEETDDGDGLPSVRVEFNPRFYKGRISEFMDRKPVGPAYLHDAKLAGGISGGPLIRASDQAVYGVNSMGMTGVYERAVSIGHMADWPIEFLKGKTLRQLADVGAIRVANEV